MTVVSVGVGVGVGVGGVHDGFVFFSFQLDSDPFVVVGLLDLGVHQSETRFRSCSVSSK